jgi:antirestriction protein ArdC
MVLIWMTYKQAQQLGANVSKGEHGSQVVYSPPATQLPPFEAFKDNEGHYGKGC